MHLFILFYISPSTTTMARQHLLLLLLFFKKIICQHFPKGNVGRVVRAQTLLRPTEIKKIKKEINKKMGEKEKMKKSLCFYHPPHLPFLKMLTYYDGHKFSIN
jgi:hypothetical protein